MKKAILFVVMLSLAAFVSVSIAADAPKAAATTSATVKIAKFGGTIKSVDATVAKTFVVSHKQNDMTFVVDDKTKITKATKDMTFADLKAGLKVKVEYKMEMDKAVAVAIMISTK